MRLLYGLYSLVKVQFANVEDVYLTLLDENLTPDDARVLFEAMEEAAGRVKAQVYACSRTKHRIGLPAAVIHQEDLSKQSFAAS